MGENYSLADIAAATDSNNDGGFGGNSAWVLIILFAMIFGWGRGGFGMGYGGNDGGTPVTEAGLCNAMNFNNLENAVGRMGETLTSQFAAVNNGICNLGYENMQAINGVSRQIADCCCTTQRAIDSVNYNQAINTSNINQNTTNQIQRVLDVICQNKQEEMQNRINQLELQAAMANVVRYPNGFCYNAGSSPFCSCGNTCNTCCNNF